MYWTNHILTSRNYKKTDWAKIDHSNYAIISDKYRTRDYQSIEEIPNYDEILEYIVAATNLYGIAPARIIADLYNAHHKQPISLKEIDYLRSNKWFLAELKKRFVHVWGLQFVHNVIIEFSEYEYYEQAAKGKPYYKPKKSTVAQLCRRFLFRANTKELEHSQRLYVLILRLMKRH